MYYLLARDLDGDGIFEYIADMEKMIITEDPHRALQLSENELSYLDMDYLNEQGFYAREIEHFNIPFLASFLFRPPVRGYRPRIAPPPRRPRPPRGPMIGPGPRIGRPGPRVAGPGPRIVVPGPHVGGPGIVRGPERGPGGPGRGPGGPSGRGPGGSRGGGRMGGPGGPGGRGR